MTQNAVQVKPCMPHFVYQSSEPALCFVNRFKVSSLAEEPCGRWTSAQRIKVRRWPAWPGLTNDLTATGPGWARSAVTQVCGVSFSAERDPRGGL